eukprot:UN07775
MVNPCGICIDSMRSDFSTFGKDCSGTCNGGKQSDECGVCLSPSDSAWNRCVGCDNIPHSGKQFNECGVCIKANDPNFNSYGKDCRGICSSIPSDTYYVDECGQCLLVTDPEWNSCSTTTEPTTISSTLNTTSQETSSTAEPTIKSSPTISNSEMSTDISQTKEQCLSGCLYYFNGCNWCWCSDLGKYTSCSPKQCNDTTNSEPYWDGCHKDQ